MSSTDFDAPPRDDILPSPDEVRRSPIPAAPHPDELDGPDDIDFDEEQITRARVPAVSWAKTDAEAADYAHLQPQGREPIIGDKRFKITAADLELLIRANGFDPKGPDTRIVFGLRGASLVDTADGRNDGTVAGVDSITLEETRPDHRNFRCTIGYLNRTTGKISAFRASTVPNTQYMTNYFMKMNGLGNSNTGANMMPTGCYVYRMGAHGGGRIYPALRLTDPERLAEDGQCCVFRTTNDLTYTTADVFDHCTPYNNIHCAYSMDKFSSAGCQTIQGPNGEGPWGNFQAVLKTVKVNTRMDYVLLTGREASIAAWLRDTGRTGDEALVGRLLKRLRPGSRGDAVSRLQKQLGLKELGYFGPATKKKLGETQRAKRILSDGIWSPVMEDAFEWSVFTAPAEPGVATPAAAPPVAAAPAGSVPASQTPPAASTVGAGTPTPSATVTPAVAAKPAEAPAPTPAAVPAPAPTATPAPTAAPAPSTASAPAVTETPAAKPVAGPEPLEQAAPTPVPVQVPQPAAKPAPAPTPPQPVAVAAAQPLPPPAASPPSPPVAPPPAAPPKPRPSGVSAAMAAELEKLANSYDPSPEAPGLVDLTRAGGTRSADPGGLAGSLDAQSGGAVKGAGLAGTAAAAGAAGVAAMSGGAAAPVAAPVAPGSTTAPAAPSLQSSQPESPAVSAPVASAPVTAPAVVGAARKLIIDKDRIAAFASRALPQYRDALLAGNEVLARYGISQAPMRLCHFLGQIGNECGRLTIIEENMTYRSAARLRAVWPSRFPTLASAEPFVNNPQKLAEKVYGGRFDNRPGDGWRYRGRGLVQITGRSSYREMGAKLKIPLEDQPDLAFDPKYALAIACETWAGKALPGERDMNRLADANKLEAMTYRINGGYTNIDDRRDAFEEAWEVWGTGKAPKRTLDPDTLDRGDRAGKVEELNARLEELGLFEGVTASRPTQVYNASTYRAVRSLQEDSGLNPTGVVGNETWSALEKAIDRGGLARAPTRSPTRSPGGAEGGASPPARNPLASRLKEIRAWSVALALLAIAFVGGYIFALTNQTGNTPLWMPLVFAGMVFVTGLALWLAARPQPHWKLDQAQPADAARTRSAPSRPVRTPGAPGSFVPDEEEPVRLGVNLG